MEIVNFVWNHLEWFVGGIGLPASILFVHKMKNFKGSNKNDLTPLMINLNRQKESLNKRTKSKLF
ncbi:MAG TPA: hypothetical protein VEF53_18865 [Patescibacteria group bacterium]|nr:hypothetical protein [Patescibacteria group bacterium]